VFLEFATWSTTDYRFDGEYFSMPPRNVLPKPYTDPHPPLWIAAGTRRSRRRPAWASACCASPWARLTCSRAYRDLQNTIDQAEPVGEYVNNNVMITSQMLCLNDGQKARDPCDMNGSYQNSLRSTLDTFPKPPFVRIGLS
jgi:alkanesulfonate monooxygenase SsuD/methylene tetrahydromethanopterin reductase-like flavin-dependent oxidoreductase (luciferase family)